MNAQKPPRLLCTDEAASAPLSTHNTNNRDFSAWSKSSLANKAHADSDETYLVSSLPLSPQPTRAIYKSQYTRKEVDPVLHFVLHFDRRCRQTLASYAQCVMRFARETHPAAVKGGNAMSMNLVAWGVD